MSFTINVETKDISNHPLYKSLVDENGIEFMLIPKDVILKNHTTDTKPSHCNECHWCFEKLNAAELTAFNTKSGNSVNWDPEENYPTCDYCMNTMCEICRGPCKDICENCSRVCHAYPCDDISVKCIGTCDRCACYPKDDIETEDCNWCDKMLNSDEQGEFNDDSGNYVFDGEEKLATCDDCMKTLCEKCDGPCKCICDKCDGVCEAYMCDVNVNSDGELIEECRCLVSVEKQEAPFEITLDNLENYSKKRLQDENVKYGLARCDNETKDKTINKLTSHLEKLSKYKTCMLKLDSDQAIEYTFPQGKTRLDLNKLLHEFFN